MSTGTTNTGVKTRMKTGPLLAHAALAASLWGAAAPAESVRLTLEQCVDLVTRQSTSVLESANQLHLSGTQLLQGYGQFLPNLAASLSYGYQNGATYYTIEGPALSQGASQVAGLTISSTLNLFNGLSDLSQLKAAIARRSAAGFSLDWAKQMVALDVTQTYLQIVLDDQLLEIARANLAASRSRLSLLRGQARVGSAALADLYRQQADTSAGEFAVASGEARVKGDQILLIRKLRVDPAKSYRFEPPDLERPSRPALSSRPLEEWLRLALENRPDLRASQSQLEATRWDLTRAHSGYEPRLDLDFARSAAGTHINQQSVNGVPEPYPSQPGLTAQLGSQVEYSLTLGLSWTLFDRLATTLAVDQARVAHDNARIATDDSFFQAQADVRTAYVNFEAATTQIGSARSGLQSAEKSYAVVEGQYEVGAASIVDVLTAQAALVQSRSNLATALVGLRLQEKTLLYSTGTLLPP